MIARPGRGSACRLACLPMAMVLAMAGCKVPVHFTQSPHVLVYSQHFSICANQSKLRDYLINNVLGLLPTFAPPPKNIDKIVIRGSVYLQIGSVAGDPSAFTIDGHGWHRMYYGETDDEDAQMYLASADYFIANGGSMYLADLRQASLVVRVIIWNKSYFSRAYLRAARNEGEIFLKIFLKKLANDVYTLDMAREHVVGVALPISSVGHKRVQPIGHMQFVPPTDERNLWDFRRTMPVATDYAGMVTTRIGAHHGQPHLGVTEWLPEFSCRELGQESL